MLTPDHIAEQFTSLVNNGAGLNANNPVIEITSGMGVFLGSIVNEDSFISKKTRAKENKLWSLVCKGMKEILI